jgi:hypothetical protein
MSAAPLDAPRPFGWWVLVGPPWFIISLVGAIVVRVVAWPVGWLARWSCRRLGWRMLAAGMGDKVARDELSATQSPEAALVLGQSGMQAGVPVMGAERPYRIAHSANRWRAGLGRTASRLWVGAIPDSAAGWGAFTLGSALYAAAGVGLYTMLA